MTQRITATVPDEVRELCLIRLGIQIRHIRAIFEARRLARAIDRAALEAIAQGAGLLHSERFLIAWNHFGVLQYWRSFDDQEQWTRRPPHSDWWRALAERMRQRDDLGVYHEAYLVPRGQIESIYLNCRPVGLSAFGPIADASGPRTTARDRLGRRVSKT